MEIVAAYLLNQLNGREVNKENMLKLLKLTGANTTEESVNLFLNKVGSMSYDEIMQAGAAKMAECAVAVGGSAAGAGEAKEEKKEEVKEESSDEDSASRALSLG